MSDFAEQVIARIREAQQKQGLSQQDIADLIGWTQSRVAQKLTRRSPTTLEELEALCFAVGLSKVEAVRDHGLEFAAEMTPSELRILERLRQLPGWGRDAILALLRLAELTAPPEQRGATKRKPPISGKPRYRPDGA